VTLPRGPGQVAAVLGVLLAGGVYVPVGVEQPAARRGRIYAAAGVRAVLTSAEEQAGLAWPRGLADSGVEVVAVDVDAGGDVPPFGGAGGVSAESVAYVIFTSGSTGEPKGVMVSHRAALNTIADVNDRFGVGPADRVLAVSALDFDLSVYDLFGLLSAGGAVVLIGEGDRREARRWARLADRWQVTIWNSAPALLDMLLTAAPEQGLAASLRVALVSGDWVGLDLPGRLAGAAPGCRLLALGGATEAAIWSNAYEVTGLADPPAHWRSVPYGYPLRNQHFRVVDARGRDCPDWVTGELWIGGAGVAEGYCGNPQATAERFVRLGGRRWYRTGDLGRYWPDGVLEFLGRADTQVKIRGHRIELGDIETTLATHPDITHAIATTAGAHHQQLAAFMIPAAPGAQLGSRPELALSAGALSRFLAERLPPYAVPSSFTVLDRFPLTPNGKVDRAALAELATGGVAVEAAGEGDPPRGPVETELAELWAELLDLPGVGRGESFFALGGDSVLGTRLGEMIRRRFGVDVPLRQVFDAPTVAGVALVIEAERAALAADDAELGLI
jgi:yersiniabactin nonribosomal peptide synthetase